MSGAAIDSAPLVFMYVPIPPGFQHWTPTLNTDA